MQHRRDGHLLHPNILSSSGVLFLAEENAGVRFGGKVWLLVPWARLSLAFTISGTVLVDVRQLPGALDLKSQAPQLPHPPDLLRPLSLHNQPPGSLSFLLLAKRRVCSL